MEDKYTLVVNPMSTDFIEDENAVCTASLGTQLPLQPIAAVTGGRYDPWRFPAVLSRQADTRTVSWIYATGKVVVVGAKNETVGFEAINSIAKMLWDTLRIKCSTYNFQMVNLVSSFKLPWSLDLDEMAKVLQHSLLTQHEAVKKRGKMRGGGGLRYQQELFHGLTWPIKIPATGETFGFSAFHTGNGVIVGMKSRSARDDANRILIDLARFQGKTKLLGKRKRYQQLQQVYAHSDETIQDESY
jgi:TATA-box binding protein (TBP) (component of TFIID and TFIIIB)